MAVNRINTVFTFLQFLLQLLSVVILANQQMESRLSTKATSMVDQSSLYVTRITLQWGLMLYIVKLIGVGVPLFHVAQVSFMAMRELRRIKNIIQSHLIFQKLRKIQTHLVRFVGLKKHKVCNLIRGGNLRLFINLNTC